MKKNKRMKTENKITPKIKNEAKKLKERIKSLGQKRKMVNIIDYAKTTSASFAEEPFNRVDSLILAQLAYVDFAAAVPKLKKNQAQINLGDFHEEMADFGKMFTHVLPRKQTRELLLALTKSPRFAQVKITDYVCDSNRTLQKQFAAVTFLLTRELNYVAFRGTDDTILGWKEDFNMSFMHSTPSQRAAVIYLKKIARKTKGQLLIGGHSKGGNLAVYATLFANFSIAMRIKKIYSHDGPGLNMGWWQSFRWSLIKNKIEKTLPQSSLVGILLETSNNYKIVKSNRLSVMQHDPFSWLIEKNDFVYANKRSKSVDHFNRSLTKWLQEVPRVKREIFVDTLYQLLTAIEIDEVRQFTHLTTTKISLFLNKIKSLDPETKALLKETFLKLWKISWK